MGPWKETPSVWPSCIRALSPQRETWPLGWWAPYSSARLTPSTKRDAWWEDRLCNNKYSQATDIAVFHLKEIIWKKFSQNSKRSKQQCRLSPAIILIYPDSFIESIVACSLGQIKSGAWYLLCLMRTEVGTSPKTCRTPDKTPLTPLTLNSTTPTSFTVSSHHLLLLKHY